MVRLDFTIEEPGAAFAERGDENGVLGAVSAERDLDTGRRGDGAFADAARDGPHNLPVSNKTNNTRTITPPMPRPYP